MDAHRTHSFSIAVFLSSSIPWSWFIDHLSLLWLCASSVRPKTFIPRLVPRYLPTYMHTRRCTEILPVLNEDPDLLDFSGLAKIGLSFSDSSIW